MALSIFIDALPFSEMQQNYPNWFPGMQLSGMIPNIAYSSSLHWELFCNKYPDDRGVLLDWKRTPEKRMDVRILSALLSPFDAFPFPSLLIRKAMDRIVFRKNMLANIPFKFRKEFTEKGKYLFWDKGTYEVEPIFKGYTVISQDEGHISFQEAMCKLNQAIEAKKRNIFFNTGFADSIGHVCGRGHLYSERLALYMKELHDSIENYLHINPFEEVIIISDHGMSTVENHISFPLESLFGKQSTNTYIAYTDSCFMCIWCKDSKLKTKIEEYLRNRKEGHLMTEQERLEAKATNPDFGDIIYILREGTCFADSWFGKGIRRHSTDGEGMHGFWPEWEARDQLASVILINGKRNLSERYTYQTANYLIKHIMQN